MLVNVAFLIGFFWLLFAIIGVQAFKGSLRRTCTWYEDAGLVLQNPTSTAAQAIINDSFTQNTPSNVNMQFCGGYLDPETGQQKLPWLKSDLDVRNLARPDIRVTSALRVRFAWKALVPSMVQ